MTAFGPRLVAQTKAASALRSTRRTGEGSRLLHLDDHALREAERRIDFVLAQAGASDWLKDTLRGARERDPVEVLNDLEILTILLRSRSELLAARSFECGERVRGRGA